MIIIAIQLMRHHANTEIVNSYTDLYVFVLKIFLVHVFGICKILFLYIYGHLTICK